MIETRFGLAFVPASTLPHLQGAADIAAQHPPVAGLDDRLARRGRGWPRIAMLSEPTPAATPFAHLKITGQALNSFARPPAFPSKFRGSMALPAMCDEMSTGDADRIEDNDLLPYCAQEADGLPATEKEKRLAHWLKEIQQLPPPQRQLLLKNFSVDELIAFHKNNKEWDKVTKQIAREFNWEEFSLAEIDDDPHHKKALGLALLAKVAYSCIDTSRSVQSCFPAWCDALIDSDFKIKSFGFQNGCSRGVIFTRGRDVVLAFRGSSKLQDLASDLDACYAPGYGGQVHKGMKRVFDDGRENLMAALDGIRREDGEPLRVALTGHSMGGVFAYFAACELANSERFDIKKIVSFGAPKVFDEQAAASYKASGLHDKTTRYEHFSDLVPFLPPVPKKIYQSIGKQYYLSKNNAIFIDPEKFQVQADQARRFGIREQIAFGFERRTILDHALDSYVKSLYIYHS